ncbi:tetratricopeptide repeat protein [Teredinibacter turnerae]|uniref:tetratricopeptide repeat protein n=1 Tax=Teredinibacter turnerae TaxID=2426 RepID=UPI0003776423|nr:tetratricopeptide repeat protein [Teredinibacter turnerae]
MRVFRILVSLVMLLCCSYSWSAGSVSGKVFKELTDIQTVMGEGKTEEAYTRLQTLLAEVDDDSLDKALTLQTLGYVEMARENFQQAIGYLKQSLALNQLPEKVVINVGYMVAQLHAALGEYDQALEFAEDWYTQLETPKPTESIFLANIYAQMKRYEEAIPYAEKAIGDSDKPKETWYQLLTASFFELKRYPKAAKSLQQMVEHWPEKATYWEQLASVYVMLEDEQSALAVLKLAFQQKLLDKESTIKSLLQLAVTRGIPEHAARMLEQAFADEMLEENATFLEMLAAAYAAAREREKAILAYERLAPMSETGDPWISISNIYVEMGEWKQAETALKKALDAKLESPGKAWLLLGIAQMELKKFDSAKNSLRKSVAFKETTKSANRWMKYVDDMKRQADWMAEVKANS